jgi:chromosome segregation ATPase
MSNEIDLVVGEVAFQKITELIKRLGDVDTEFGKIATKFSDLGKTSNPQSTAELAKLTAENQKLNKALNDLKASYTTIDTELAKNTKLITDATLATKAKTAADTLALKATEDQNSAYVKAAGAYANLDAQHKLAVKTAQDLAVATGRSTKEYENAKNKANELDK